MSEALRKKMADLAISACIELSPEELEQAKNMREQLQRQREATRSQPPSKLNPTPHTPEKTAS